MATIAFLEKRIEGKQKEIDRLDKRADRIRDAINSDWEDNRYGYTESDLRSTLRDLEDAYRSLEKYKKDLAIAKEKASSRNIAVILDFLQSWKDRCFEFYEEGLQQYYAESKRVDQLYNTYNGLPYGTEEYNKAKAEYKEAAQKFSQKRKGYFEDYHTEGRGYAYSGKRKVRNGEYEHLNPYYFERTIESALAKVAKDLQIEADRKYDYIIERTNAFIGEITDAEGLTIGDKGDLNGYIIGKKGRVKVRTIGAGGYNIQCFHFRTLINKVKEEDDG